MKLVHTICYFSKAIEELTHEDIYEIFGKTDKNNNKAGITGILLHSLGNFFQVLEGDEKQITDLYKNKIKLDSRHHNLFEVINKREHKPIFAQYDSRFQTVDNKEQLDEIKQYLASQAIQSSTSEKIARLLKSFVILD